MNVKQFSITILALLTSALIATQSSSAALAQTEHPDVTVVNAMTREIGEFNEEVSTIEAGSSLPEETWSGLKTANATMQAHEFARVSDEYATVADELVAQAAEYTERADAIQAAPIDSPREATETLNQATEPYSEQVGKFESALVRNAQFQELNLANPLVRVALVVGGLLLVGIIILMIVLIRRRKNRSTISKNKSKKK